MLPGWGNAGALLRRIRMAIASTNVDDSLIWGAMIPTLRQQITSVFERDTEFDQKMVTSRGVEAAN